MTQPTLQFLGLRIDTKPCSGIFSMSQASEQASFARVVKSGNLQEAKHQLVSPMPMLPLPTDNSDN